MNSSLLLQVGQNAGHIANELNRIRSSLKLEQTFSSVKCFQSHHLQTSATVISSSDVDIIAEQIRNCVEDIDLPKEISLLVDFSNSNGIVGPLLDEISLTYPGLIISAVTLDFNSCNGLGVLNAVPAVQKILTVCDSVCLRNLTDIQLFLSQENISNYNISDICKVVASDLIVAYTANNVALPCTDSLFPRNICTARSKIFDIRTSCWKYLNCIGSVEKQKKYNSLRSLANNLHALHVSHEENIGHLNVESINKASLIHAALDKRFKQLVTHSFRFTSSEIATAMGWATPGLIWPVFGRQVVRDTKSGMMTIAPESSAWQAMDHGDSQSISTRESSKLGGYINTNTATMSTGFELPDSTSIAAISFESPYAKQYLTKVCKTAVDMMQAGAYSHRLGGEYEIELVNDCLEDIFLYLEGSS